MPSKLIRVGVLLGISFLSETAQAQSPIPLSFFGMHIHGYSNPWPALPIGSRRDIDLTWKSINTSAGQYDWKNFDYRLNRSIVNGADYVFDFEAPPPWATTNPNAGPCAWGVGTCAPPKMQYWTDWVTAVVTHAGGQVKYWEIWNEPNDTSSWAGDIPTMVALARQAYRIVKSIDPTAKVLTPAVYTDPSGMLPNNGVAWLIEFLRQCSVPPAGSNTAPPCADILAYHGYPMNWPFIGAATPPPSNHQGDIDPASYPLLGEQAVIDVENYKNIAAMFGLEAVWSTEGGLGVWVAPGSCQQVDANCLATANSTTANRQLSAEYAVKATMLMQAGGIGRSYWYAYDDITTGYLWGGQGTSLNEVGTAYALLGQFVGTTPVAPAARQATANRISNPTANGAIVGTPGTPPTNWRVIAGDGVQTSFVGVGVENGSVDFRIQGTPSASGEARIEFEAPGQIPSSGPGKQWFGSINQSLIGGSYSNVAVYTGLVEYDANGVALNYTGGMIAPGTSLDFTLQQNVIMAITRSPYCASVVPVVAFKYGAGQSFDITLRLGRASLDDGTTWQGTYTRPDGSSVILAWDSSGSSPVLSLNQAYTRYQDVSGTFHPISGNQVTLTNSPIFIVQP